jgi:hypothetical protein
MIRLRVSTEWHEPHNTTTHNDYTEFIEAENAKAASKKAYQEYVGVLTNPNKSIGILSVKKL